MRTIFFLLSLLLCVPLAHGQKMVITSKADLSQACLSDTIEVEYAVSSNNRFQKIAAPVFPGFEQLKAPVLTQKTSHTRQEDIFVAQYETIYTFHLLPKMAGRVLLPVLTLQDEAGRTVSSNQVAITIVADCSSKRKDTTYRSSKEEQKDFLKGFLKTEDAALLNFNEKILTANQPYVVDISPKSNNRSAENNYLSIAELTLKDVATERIGIEAVNFTIDGLSHLYYGIADTTKVRETFHNRLPDSVNNALTISFFTWQNWERQKSIIKETPEYKLYFELGGAITTMLLQDELMEAPRNIYLVYAFSQKADRDSCIQWAKAKGLRVLAPGDLNDNKKGKYYMWVSINRAAILKEVFPEINQVNRSVLSRFGNRIMNDGVTMQMLRKASK